MNSQTRQGYDDLVLKRLRGMPEVELHSKVVIPLLKKMPFECVRYVHGVFERGKDLIYLSRDAYGDEQLEVCQVKNGPFTGKAGRKTNTIDALSQIRSCRMTEVLNPKTNQKEKPQAVVLLTTYPLTDKDTADRGGLLQELKELECKIVGPEKLVDLIAEWVPDIYEEIALLDLGIKRGIASYLRISYEMGVFQLARTICILDYYVNLEIVKKKVNVDLMLRKAHEKKKILTACSPKDFIKLDEEFFLPATVYEEICDIVSCLPEGLCEYPLIPDSHVAPKTHGSGYVVRKVDLLGFIKNAVKVVKKLATSKKKEDLCISMNVIYVTDTFVEYMLDRCGFHFNMGDPDEISEALKELRMKDMPPEIILGFKNNLCIVGEAGAGKTSIAKMLAHRAIQEGKNCVYFPCSHLQKEQGNLFKEMCKFIHSLSPNSSPESVEKYCEEAEVVILDGCDEATTFGKSLGASIRDLSFNGEISENLKVSPNTSLQTPSELEDSVYIDLDRKELVISDVVNSLDVAYLFRFNKNTRITKALDKLYSRYKKTNPQVIVTSRSSEPLGLGRNFHEVSLVPFDDEQLERFFRNWFKGTNKSYKEILDFLKDNDYIREICRIPIVTTLVAALYENGYELPKSKTELYKKRFRLLLSEWDQSKTIAPRGKIKAEDKYSLLVFLAYELHRKHRNSFIKDDLENIWNTKLKRHYPKLGIDTVIWELQVYNSIISPVSEHRYCLGHLSFQEFLTAEAVFRNRTENLLVSNFYNDWWRNVIVFYAGVCGDISSFIDRMLNLHCIEENRGLLKEMLSEARYTPDDVRAIIDDSIELDKVLE